MEMYKLLGFEIIKRVRKYKNRYEVTNGECFYGIHIGKYSYYVSKPNAKRRFWNMNKLVDIKGLVTTKVVWVNKDGKELVWLKYMVIIVGHLIMKTIMSKRK